jgi:arginyl-tRNA synthetase
MRILAELRTRFRFALRALLDDDLDPLLAMIRPSQDPRFGDYQANCAMPLGKRLGQPPREIASQLVEHLDAADLCCEPEIAGPGFINLRLRDDWLEAQLSRALRDERLAVATAETARTVIIDFSAPNVAKPMHVGHIRSTVIGDALYRILRFLGHHVVGDNHLGDWGTQFGMILYGYKHFRDDDHFQRQPVAELARLYKLVNCLVEYWQGKQRLPEMEQKIIRRAAAVEAARSAPKTGEKAADKKAARALRKLETQAVEAAGELAALRANLAALEADSQLFLAANEHSEIAAAVLEETAKLHAGDEENRRLWEEFLPKCRQEIQRVYNRLGVEFDHEYGESFYQDRLADVVADFEKRELARLSDGAVCLFLDGFDAPMIIRKQDGAFLYATTDLATIQFRMETWNPAAILYVVDHRQSEHFEKLFAAARLWGCGDVELQHISFGTVLGEDGRPYKTRSGDTIDLEGLLDEAVDKAYSTVAANDDQKPNGAELTEDERRHVASVVGHGAIKYADLAHNRTSDYIFSYDKMLALNGNTATYMQYSYARVGGIFAKASIDPASVRQVDHAVRLTNEYERSLGLALLRFADALDEALEDYRPNQLTSYLFDVSKTFSSFFEHCQVVKAEEEVTRTSRLALCDLTGRTIRQGLNLLGIEVVDRM